tara:strand:+ start:7607 stop:8092 length:486 start_codon:yes stop_codon:yes gene_type:complete
MLSARRGVQMPLFRTPVPNAAREQPISLTLTPSVNAIILPKAQTPRLPRRPRRSRISTALCPILQDSRLPIQALIIHIIHATRLILGLALEQRKNILHAQLANRLAAFNCGVGKLAFRFLQLEDALFNGVVDAEAVDGYINGLVEAVDSIDGLLFDELWGC